LAVNLAVKQRGAVIEQITAPHSNAANRGAPGVTRTPDTRFRKPLLYPPELRGQSRTYADETGRCEAIWSNDRPFIG
jgi:hypothetical protein